MSADILRRAATVMRERAAHLGSTRIDWRAMPTIDPENEGWVTAFGSADDDFDTTVARFPYDYDGAVATYSASWHPAVALAVADLLNRQADFIERGGDFSDIEAGGDASCLAIAHAYLGEDA